MVVEMAASLADWMVVEMVASLVEWRAETMVSSTVVLKVGRTAGQWAVSLVV